MTWYEKLPSVGDLIKLNVSAVFIEEALIGKTGIVIDHKKVPASGEHLFKVSVPCGKMRENGHSYSGYEHKIVDLFRSEFESIQKLGT